MKKYIVMLMLVLLMVSCNKVTSQNEVIDDPTESTQTNSEYESFENYPLDYKPKIKIGKALNALIDDLSYKTEIDKFDNKYIIATGKLKEPRLIEYQHNQRAIEVFLLPQGTDIEIKFTENALSYDIEYLKYDGYCFMVTALNNMIYMENGTVFNNAKTDKDRNKAMHAIGKDLNNKFQKYRINKPKNFQDQVLPTIITEIFS